jgi:2,3-diphosphopglycerate-independent phosphoglycerate mutase
VDREFNKWGLELCPVLDKLELPGYPDYKVSCEYATEHRCGLKVSGPGMTYHITGQDPLVDNRPLPKVEPTLQDDPKAKFTADLVQVLSDTIRKTLREHPINVERKAQGLPYTNFLTLRGCGQRLQVPSFASKYGLTPFMISPTAIIRGVGITFQIPLIEVEGTTGYYDSNLDGKASKAAELLATDEYDFGFVHVKATDDAGHDKSHELKV